MEEGGKGDGEKEGGVGWISMGVGSGIRETDHPSQGSHTVRLHNERLRQGLDKHTKTEKDL